MPFYQTLQERRACIQEQEGKRGQEGEENQDYPKALCPEWAPQIRR